MKKVIFTLMLSLMLLVSINSSQAVSTPSPLQHVGTATYDGIATYDGTDPFVCNVWYDSEVLWLDHLFVPATWKGQTANVGVLGKELTIQLFDNWTFDSYDDTDWVLPEENEYLTLPEGNVFGIPDPKYWFWTCEFDDGCGCAYAIDPITRNAEWLSASKPNAGLAVNHAVLHHTPIPGALWLLGSGILALAGISRKRNLK